MNSKETTVHTRTCTVHVQALSLLGNALMIARYVLLKYQAKCNSVEAIKRQPLSYSMYFETVWNTQ